MHKARIKVTAFDLDNTLYNENKYFEAVINEFCKVHDFETRLFINDFYKIKRNSGDVFGDLLKLKGIYTQDLQRELFSIYQLINIKLKPFPSALNVLQLLKEKLINTAIITNGDLTVQQNKIKSLALEDKVDLIIYARKWGQEFEKPHSKPFDYLLEYFSCSPNEILYVGDNEDNDIKAAAAVGLKTYKLNRWRLFLVLKYIEDENMICALIIGKKVITGKKILLFIQKKKWLNF